MFCVNYKDHPHIEDVEFIDVPPVEGVKDATIAQLVRLFANQYNFNHDDVLIIGDADMVVAKNIFTAPLPASYGFDLTGRSEIPMCYVEATAAQWLEMMGASHLSIPDKAFSETWEDYWSTDQQLLTAKAKEYGFDRITFVDRGNNNKHGLPTGRWDRHDWSNVPDDIIDVHMVRNDWPKQFEVCKRLWPGDNFGWLADYAISVGGATQLASMISDKKKKEVYQLHLNDLAKKCPEWLQGVSNWSNHRPMLLLALSLSSHLRVTELGSGDGSTKYLQDYCDEHSRLFESLDGNKEWCEKTGSRYVENWDALIAEQNKYMHSVIFIDHAPGERRWSDTVALANSADILVLHDTEEGGAGDYKWNQAIPNFRYHLHYNRHGGGAGASMVSNTIDVTVYKGLTLGAFRFDD